jgi:hypothetical protein
MFEFTIHDLTASVLIFYFIFSVTIFAVAKYITFVVIVFLFHVELSVIFIVYHTNFLLLIQFMNDSYFSYFAVYHAFVNLKSLSIAVCFLHFLFSIRYLI